MEWTNTVHCIHCGEANSRSNAICSKCGKVLLHIPQRLFWRYYHGKLKNETDVEALQRLKVIK